MNFLCQILMGQRKPDVRYTGDRDFLPPCSYEVPILVELLNVCSGHLNVWVRLYKLNACFVKLASTTSTVNVPLSLNQNLLKPSVEIQMFCFEQISIVVLELLSDMWLSHICITQN